MLCCVVLCCAVLGALGSRDEPFAVCSYQAYYIPSVKLQPSRSDPETHTPPLRSADVSLRQAVEWQCVCVGTGGGGVGGWRENVLSISISIAVCVFCSSFPPCFRVKLW